MPLLGQAGLQGLCSPPRPPRPPKPRLGRAEQRRAGGVGTGPLEFPVQQLTHLRPRKSVPAAGCRTPAAPPSPPVSTAVPGGSARPPRSCPRAAACPAGPGPCALSGARPSCKAGGAETPSCTRPPLPLGTRGRAGRMLRRRDVGDVTGRPGGAAVLPGVGARRYRNGRRAATCGPPGQVPEPRAARHPGSPGGTRFLSLRGGGPHPRRCDGVPCRPISQMGTEAALGGDRTPPSPRPGLMGPCPRGGLSTQHLPEGSPAPSTHAPARPPWLAPTPPHGGVPDPGRARLPPGGSPAPGHMG